MWQETVLLGAQTRRFSGWRQINRALVRGKSPLVFEFSKSSIRNAEHHKCDIAQTQHRDVPLQRMVVGACRAILVYRTTIAAHSQE